MKKTTKSAASEPVQPKAEAPSTPQTGLLTMDEAIAMLKTTRPTFYRWVRSGRLRGTKLGRQWRFTRGDVDRFLKGQEPQIALPLELQPLIGELQSQLKRVGIPSETPSDQGKIAQAVTLMIRLAVGMNASDM